MAEPSSAIRNISDTALWVALYRAQESERPDALFHDPYARRLAGERGARIAASTSFMTKHAWSLVARTVLIDRIVMDEAGQGVDMVVNLAAGLDTRPYRLALPPALRWVEVDLPGILEYKEPLLGDDVPKCQLRRERCDLSDEPARRALLERLGQEAKRALVLTEGLLVYLTDAGVQGLARDLSAQASFRHWAFDICSPGLLRTMQKREGGSVAAAGAPYRFAPGEGPEYFLPLGWRLLSAGSVLHCAARHRRLSWPLRLAARMTPPAFPRRGNRLWSGVCLMEAGNR